MDRELEKIVRRVKASQARMNPSGPDEVELDSGWLLQLELIQSDYEFTEDELYEALRAVGVPEDYQMSWFEDFASYV